MAQIILNFSLILLSLHIISRDSDNPVISNVEAPRPEVTDFNNTNYATCDVTPVLDFQPDQPEISGQVLFKQVFPNGTLKVIVNLQGLPDVDEQVRAIHIHQYGDLSKGCVRAGPHYNPQGVDHPGYPGDMGNFISMQGIIRQILKPHRSHAVWRSIHIGTCCDGASKEDDLGMGSDEESKCSGNAGKRKAHHICGRRR